MIHLLQATVDDVLDAGDRLLGRVDGAGAEQLVDVADRDAADRRRADADRRRTLAGRLALRLLACAVGGRPPSAAASLTVDRTCDRCGAPHGRPRLAGASASTSTSGDLVLVAVADPAARVGVDVERLPEALWDGFDEYALHPAERAGEGASSPGDADIARRLQIWTDKEAVLKSVGVGLRTAPASFRVAATAVAGGGPSADGSGWRPVAECDDPALRTVWTATVDVGRAAAGSVAAAGPSPVRSWTIGDVSGQG
ncbi:4'-phosphopantetheinyl transferase superfamily protein [Curtobacterium sp. MCSS17_008]|uniref:4'-phosphopantetheinyl transferase family protein n=1 Tax=Curtobacterium sp. MCSS17_008 TaxID=2175647 RepID=UPI0015E89520|nr:4'-phosphopantetheinyl transferase superfamily protein [Curtobacterium sp. MCSS17_008]